MKQVTKQRLAQRLKMVFSVGTALPILLLGVGSPAFAQDQAAVNQEDPALSSPRVEDIVVTANKREETLQDTPVAVSVVGAQEIERSRPSTWCNFGGGLGSSSGGLCGDV